MAIQIAIAVVEHDGSFLIGQRPAGIPLAGLWEFPGGKMEPGESPAAAAVRECYEETGLSVRVVGEYPQHCETYKHDRVELHFFQCKPLEPEKEPTIPYRWVARHDLANYEFPKGNRVVLKLLSGGFSESNLSPSACFYIAPFAIDGGLMGIGKRDVADLSPKWLKFSRELLVKGGKTFQSTLGRPLEHIELKFTSGAGAALATFSIRGQLAASAMYLRGENAPAEQDLISMFVESLGRTSVVQQLQTSSEPFCEIASIRRRPLLVVVPWINEEIVDHDQVRELGIHIAAVFLCE